MNKILPGFHILIIDDDQDDHFFFTDALKELGQSGFTNGKIINLSSMYSGIQGINFLLKQGTFKNSTEPLPDFIVLDLHMPMMDGYEVLNEIKTHAKLKSIPVYMLTSSESENSTKCLDNGCAGFFSKPLEIEELKSVIMQMLKHFI